MINRDKYEGESLLKVGSNNFNKSCRLLSGLVIKEEKAQDAVLFLFLVYIVVISAVKALRAVQNLDNKYINLVANGFTQGLEVFTDSFYYLGFLVLLVFIALALRYLLFVVKETSDRKR